MSVKSSVELVSHLSMLTFAPSFLLGCSSATLLFSSLHPNCHFSHPPLSLTSPSLSFSSFLPLSECSCFTLLCGFEWRSPREAEHRMYPRGLFGALFSMDQHALERQTDRPKDRQLHAPRGTGPPIYLKTQIQSSTKHLAFQTLHWHVQNFSLKQRKRTKLQ